MASYEKRNGRWRARVYVNHQRDAQTFDTKAQAVAWANLREQELTGARLPDKSVTDALRRYADEVSPTHKGRRWEELRLTAWERTEWAKKPLQALGAPDLAQWKLERLQAGVAPATVRREMTLLGSVLDTCVREWHWLRANPMASVKKPDAPPSRKRRISESEVERIVTALGYESGPPENASQRVALVFLFALETAMRSGEITGLRWGDIGTASARLPETKNGDARSVPLSKRAREILALMPKGEGPIFGLDGALRDALFRKARDRAQIADLHFHDSRAEAIWRLSKKLDVLELARAIGHRDLRSLLIYYQTSADELAARLD